MDANHDRTHCRRARFLRKLWALARPYWFAEERQRLEFWGFSMIDKRGVDRPRAARGRSSALSVLIVYMSKLFNAWNARFYNALQDKNAEAFWDELIYWVVLAAIFIVAAVYRLWLTQLLTIRWRRWLSEVYFRDWLADRTYYRMELISARAPTTPSSASSRTARRLPRRRLNLAGQPAAAGHDADHLRHRAVGPVGRASCCRSSAASPFPAT